MKFLTHICLPFDATVTWECMEMRAFGDAPPPRRRVGCARIGTDVMICGGTRYIHIHPYIISLVARLVERSPRLQSIVGSNPTQGSLSWVRIPPRAACRGFESHPGQLFFFPWRKRAVLDVVVLFVVPLPFYYLVVFTCTPHQIQCHRV